MRAIISRLLLFFILVPSTITIVRYCWSHYQKMMVRQEVKRRQANHQKEETLVLLKFTTAESETLLRWEHAQEFEYQQQMYDVVKWEMIGDTIYYWCWWDKAETKINQQIADLGQTFFNIDLQKKEKENRLMVYLKSMYCSSFVAWNWFLIALKVENTFHLTPFYSCFLTPPTPPPKVITTI